MTYEELEILVKAIAILVALFITKVIKPLIDSKVSQQEYAKLEELVKIAVRCAEQIFTPEEWEQKKEYVVAYVNDILGSQIKLTLSMEQIDTLIEGCVNLVKRG